MKDFFVQAEDFCCREEGLIGSWVIFLRGSFWEIMVVTVQTVYRLFTYFPVPREMFMVVQN
jgi:hypothetical protein